MENIAKSTTDLSVEFLHQSLKMAMIFWAHAFLRRQGAWKLRKNMKSDVLKGEGGDADLPFLMILILIRTGALIWECTEPSAHWCRDTYLCVRLISRGYICQSNFPIWDFLSRGCIKLIGRHEQLGKGKEIDWSSKSSKSCQVAPEKVTASLFCLSSLGWEAWH